MVRLDRTIGRSKPVRARVRRTMVRSARTMAVKHGPVPTATHPRRPLNYSAASTNFARGVIRNTSIDAARHAIPLAMNANK